MEVKRNKIVDNTFISSSLKEVVCVNLIDLLDNHYNLFTCENVFNEAKEKFFDDVKEIFSTIKVVKHKDETKADKIIEYCINRYPYLHIGEVSSFVLFILNYNPENSYYVTDDKAMRKSIEKIKVDELFHKLIGFSIENYIYTGTIGLIIKLKNKKVLNGEDIENIIKNLNESSFRVSQELLEELRK